MRNNIYFIRNRFLRFRQKFDSFYFLTSFFIVVLLFIFVMFINQRYNEKNIVNNIKSYGVSLIQKFYVKSSELNKKYYAEVDIDKSQTIYEYKSKSGKGISGESEGYGYGGEISYSPPPEIERFICGNGIREKEEECDMFDFDLFNGKCNLYSKSYVDGNLVCDANCKIDTRNCVVRECETDVDCEDDLYCNGKESCFNGRCKREILNYNDGIDCTIDYCNESLNLIVHETSNKFCSDEIFCNGEEICILDEGCINGTIKFDDKIECTKDFCNEEKDIIEHIKDDDYCLNKLFCDGEEICDINIGCIKGEDNCKEDESCYEESDLYIKCKTKADKRPGDNCVNKEEIDLFIEEHYIGERDINDVSRGIIAYLEGC